MLIKRKGRRRLTLELILMTVVSLIAGVLTAQIVEDIGLRYALNKIDGEDYYMELLATWAQREKNVYVVFYRDVDALFNSNMIFPEEDTENPLNGSSLPFYDVTLWDGTVIKAEVDCYMDPHIFYMADIAGYMAGGMVFILILFLLIHQKIRYINRLDQELRILGSGNLEYPMTIRGNDEITTLAEGIERLKNSILEQQLMKDAELSAPLPGKGVSVEADVGSSVRIFPGIWKAGTAVPVSGAALRKPSGRPLQQSVF